MSSCTYLHPCQSPIGFTQMFWLVSFCCVMRPYVHNSFICTKIEWNMKRIKAQISNQIRLRIFESQINGNCFGTSKPKGQTGYPISTKMTYAWY